MRRRHQRVRSEEGLTFIEYFLLVVSVVGVLFFLIGPGGIFRARVQDTMSISTQSMSDTVGQIANGSFSVR